MMQRDEKLLLDAWLRYYGYLFGFENLTVFDNGSVEPDVLRTLKIYEEVGVTVVWEHKRVEDFHAKGAHFKNVVQHWDAIGGYDLAIPLDCDEFVAVVTEDGLDCRRSAIHDRLDEFIGEDRVLGITHSFYNVPAMSGFFWPDRYPKTFLAADTIAELDHGFHAARSRKAEGVRDTSLTYLHMHNKPFDVLLEHSRRKLALFVDVDDRDLLRAYTGPGRHLVRYFFMTEDDYAAQFKGKVLFEVNAFGRLLAALGVSSPLVGRQFHPASGRPDAVRVLTPSNEEATTRSCIEFDAQAYLEANPDVGVTSWLPFQHFFAAGAAEGRRLRPVGSK